MNHECIIGIGSNIDSDRNIAAALSYLRQDHRLISISSLILTSPVGIRDQPDFMNGAVKMLTTLEMSDFKNYLKNIEDRLKRDRTVPKFGPRTIDLDIVSWDGKIIDEEYYTRDFLKKVVDEVS